MVTADASSLGHALWNLLDNAVKYSPGATAIGVSIRRAGPSIQIAVTDTGIGIPVHEQQNIFGRFVRGRSARRLGIRGTGLGLAIVSHIVDVHRGTVHVESVEGAGSTFTIALPAADGGRDSVAEGRLVGSAGRA
jgi:two-component system sensor histidine kinase SenX3